MADDKAKKTKIDLKARLGRTTQMGIAPPAPLPPPSAPGATPPPPPDSGSSPFNAPPSAPASRPSTLPGIPQGIAPPAGIGAGLSPGIPLPPFGPQPRQAPRAEPKQSAAQQTIKVELGEEIHEERKKARNRAIGAAFAGALIGIGIGWVAGGSASEGARVKSAARGAGQLEKDVKTANDKLKDLDAKLTEAAEKFKNKSFPDDLASALAGMTIPFDETNLDGKGVQGLKSNLFKAVLDYTNSCKNLNKSRESLKNLIGLAKDPITKAWKEETAPMANFSVVFRTEGGKNVVAELVPNPTPFTWKGDFPEKYKVSRAEGPRTAEKEVKRYAKGDLPGNDLTAIPVDPKTTSSLAGGEVFNARLNKALYDMRVELEGNKDDPNGSSGVLKTGDDLAVELHKQSLLQ
jgi:hypothetical protein